MLLESAVLLRDNEGERSLNGNPMVETLRGDSSTGRRVRTKVGMNRGSRCHSKEFPRNRPVVICAMVSSVTDPDCSKLLAWKKQGIDIINNVINLKLQEKKICYCMD